MIQKQKLLDLYVEKKKSMHEIAQALGCSVRAVSYWMDKHGMARRSKSDATYVKRNPNGDPFLFREPKTIEEAKLFGMGIGLYWGEGTKASKNSIRLGNTDPKLIALFMKFLCTFFGVDRSDFHFGLQIFTDINPSLALDFWSKRLRIPRSQFSKPIVTRSVSRGTYRKKSLYGVVTIMYHNKKLRDLLVGMLPL